MEVICEELWRKNGVSKRVKGYTQEELEKIKKLYAEGYSAILIREMIGRPASREAASAWLLRMQKNLKLPKRGMGFMGIRKGASPRSQLEFLELRLVRARKRKAKIRSIIDRINERKRSLIGEFFEICSDIARLEKQIANAQEKVVSE